MKISIVGDSSSSTIGDYTYIYPNILYNIISKEKNCKIFNYSVPGMTSTDAKSIYFSEINKINNDILILYLGNNESSYGNYKGHHSHFFWNFRKIFLRKKNYNQFFYLKKKFKFSYGENHSIQNQHYDFKKNLEDIIKHALKKNIFIILINPIANRSFPSGAGITNFVFFKLVNFHDNVGNLLIGCDKWSDLLIKGIKFHEDRNYQESIKIYKKIADKKNVLSVIAKNNLATIFAETNLEKSKILFNDILNNFQEYNSIIYYNLHLIEKEKNEEEAKRYLNLAYSNDFSLYRIKNEYRKTLIELQHEYDIHYLDLKNILTDKDFIDYCHPKKEAHKKIAENIINLINIKKNIFKKSEKNFYVNKLVSPDYYNDPTKNFVDYNFIEKDISKDKIMSNLSNLLNEYKFEEFKNTNLVQKHLKDKNICYIINFIQSNIEHPVFTKSLISKEIYTPLQNEIFSVPENYIHRIMYNYIKYFEKNIQDELIGIDKSLFNSKFYKQIILRNNSLSLDLPLFLEKNYQIEIEKKVYLYTKKQNQLFTNNIYNRLKTIMYWYTRESFRYGTLSRNSMLYDKLSIDRLIETFIVLLTIDFTTNLKKKNFYIQIFSLLNSLTEIHEKHVNRFLVGENFDNLKYNEELNENKKNFILVLDKLVNKN